MKTIPLSEIIISPDRQRREFNAESLAQLAADIEENGLYNAVVLRVEPWIKMDGSASGARATLVQGERRLRAISDIYGMGGSFKHDGCPVPAGEVPYTTLGELDPLAAEIAELHENLRRENLTWQEEAAATARIAAIRGKQAEASGKPLPTNTEIAREVKDIPPSAKPGEVLAFDTVSKELMVAKHLHDPEVRAAKTLRDAVKVLKRKETAQRNEALGIEVGKTFGAGDHTVLNEDAIPWLANCPDGLFDVICTDQPFGMGADEFGDSAGKAAGAHGYADDEEIFTACLEALLGHSCRITKAQAHLYWFCDIDKFALGRAAFSSNGWQVHRTPLIWHKTGDKGRVPWPDYGPRRAYELILYAVKGKKPVTQIAPDVLSFPTEENLGHSAQKPVALLHELLKRSVVAGNSILDPFLGTGSIIPAAHELKCKVTGIEKDAASYGIAVQRLKDLK